MVTQAIWPRAVVARRMKRTLDVEKGLEELRSKQMIDIERATAITWGGRAAASFRLALEADKLGQQVRHLYEGENYRQEALEHAAMTEDLEFFERVAREIEEYRKKALVGMQDVLTESAPTQRRGLFRRSGRSSSREVHRPGGKYQGEKPISTGARGGPAGVRGKRLRREARLRAAEP
jgi:hypothetical protein